MSASFILGIRELSSATALMSVPGIYWINSDRKADAELLVKQVFLGLSLNAPSALITGEGNSPAFLAEDNLSMGVTNIFLFSLAAKKAALECLSKDLPRSLKGKNWIVVLLINSEAWTDFAYKDLQHWLFRMDQWSQQQQSTLLILCHGSKSIFSPAELTAQYRNLQGIANLERRATAVNYKVFWWSNQQGITTDQLFSLKEDEHGWAVERQGHNQTLSSEDENLYLAEKLILEGAPALSNNWRVFDGNEKLIEQARSSKNATLIFSFSKREELEFLAKSIHDLRLKGGSQLKIVIREMNKGLRYSEQQLFLAAGANLLVPYPSSLSKFLTILESVRGQQFVRPLPPNLDDLFAALRPLKLKGYISLPQFCEAVNSIVENSLLPKNEKGVLVGLRPVPSLQLGQAVALCQIRRLGDIMTVTKSRIYIFLFQCRVSDLETALNAIFHFPVKEMFSNHLLWFQDQQIAAKINKLSLLPHNLLIQPISHKTTTAEGKTVKNKKAKHTPVELDLDSNPEFTHDN